MSTFSTPFPPDPETAEPACHDPSPPQWLNILTTLSSCTICALLLLYLSGRVKCERLVNWTLLALLVVLTMTLGWLVGSGEMKRLKQCA
jgi:hypothetical protein